MVACHCFIFSRTSNSDFQKFIYDTRISEFDVHKLLVEGLLQEARKLNLKPILWNDAYNHGYTMVSLKVFDNKFAVFTNTCDHAM